MLTKLKFTIAQAKAGNKTARAALTADAVLWTALIVTVSIVAF